MKMPYTTSSSSRTVEATRLATDRNALSATMPSRAWLLLVTRMLPLAIKALRMDSKAASFWREASEALIQMTAASNPATVVASTATELKMSFCRMVLKPPEDPADRASRGGMGIMGVIGFTGFI